MLHTDEDSGVEFSAQNSAASDETEDKKFYAAKMKSKSPIKRGKNLDDVTRQVLHENRSLLVKNVQLTDDICARLLEHEVLSEASASRILKLKTNEERFGVIYDDMKSAEQFHSFSDVLLLCFHPMIGEYLRTLAFTSAFGSNRVDISDLWKSIPSLEKSLKQSEREKLAEYINSKIIEEVFQSSLKELFDAKEPAADLKKKYVEQSWKHVKELKEKTLSSDKLRSNVEHLEALISEKDREISNLKEKMRKSEDKHAQQVSVSTKFNMATENALRRAQEKLDAHIHVVDFFQKQLDPYLNKIQTAEPETDPSEAQSRKEDDFLGITDETRILRELEKNCLLFMEFVNELEKDRFKLRKLQKQADFVISQLDPCNQEEKTLRGALRASLIRHDEEMNKLNDEIKLLNDFIHMKLPDNAIPEKLQGVSLPTVLKDEYIKEINSLQKDLSESRALLEEKNSYLEHMENRRRHLSADLKKALAVKEVSEEEVQTDDVSIRPKTPVQLIPVEEAEELTPVEAVSKNPVKTRPRGNMTVRRMPVERPEPPPMPPPLGSDFVLQTQSLKNSDSSKVALAKRRRPVENLPTLRRSHRVAMDNKVSGPHTTPAQSTLEDTSSRQAAPVEVSQLSDTPRQVGSRIVFHRQNKQRGFPQGHILQSKAF